MGEKEQNGCGEGCEHPEPIQQEVADCSGCGSDSCGEGKKKGKKGNSPHNI